MSGLVLEVTPPMLVSSSRAFADLLPLVPTAKRAFARSDRVTAFVRVNESAGRAAQPVTIMLTVKDANDRTVVTATTSLAAEAFVESRGADYRFELPLDRLIAGEHLLTIEATRGSQTVRRAARFSVQ
jgi:hypothetical protein